MSVKELSGEEVKDAINKSGVVVVEFYAPWCSHCRRMAPVYKEAAEELGGKAMVCSVNGDENEEIMAQFEVEVYPTVLFFKDGAKKDSAQGQFTKEKILDKVSKL